MIRKAVTGFMFIAFTLAACNADEKSTGESKDVAKEANEEKFETTASQNDAQFVVDAASACFDEIKIADVALAKSTNQQVQQIAQQIKDEHSAMITELNAIASKTAITVPAVASDQAAKLANNLAEAGKNFDKRWLQAVRDMHEASIRKFEDGSTQAADVDIKKWASAMLVKMRAHLNLIAKAQESIK